MMLNMFSGTGSGVFNCRSAYNCLILVDHNCICQNSQQEAAKQ